MTLPQTCAPMGHGLRRTGSRRCARLSPTTRPGIDAEVLVQEGVHGRSAGRSSTRSARLCRIPNSRHTSSASRTRSPRRCSFSCRAGEDSMAFMKSVRGARVRAGRNQGDRDRGPRRTTTCLILWATGGRHRSPRTTTRRRTSHPENAGFREGVFSTRARRDSGGPTSWAWAATTAWRRSPRW